MAPKSQPDVSSNSGVDRAVAEISKWPEVLAIALGGSRACDQPHASSDFDLYVYAHREPPLAARRSIAPASAEIGNRRWEPGDEWVDSAGGTRIDIMYRSPAWIEDQLDRVLVRHEPSLGYSTCLWFNVLHSRTLFDPRRWFEDLQKRASVEYPDPLRLRIVQWNWPVLRDAQSSYRRQIEIALERNDLVSVQHRVTALLTSVFDIWFAIERLPHPGEKRLLSHLPPDWRRKIERVLRTQSRDVLKRIDALLDALEARILSLGLSAACGRIEHIALWVTDLERSLAFYRKWFPSESGSRYDSARRPFSSYFVALPGGIRMELMQAPGELPRPAHVAISVGSRQAVDNLVSQMVEAGVPLTGPARVTGDGYYEAVVLDPDGIPIEITE